MDFGKWPMKYEFFFMVEKLVVNVLIYKDGFRLQIVRNLDFCKAKENGSISERIFQSKPQIKIQSPIP